MFFFSDFLNVNFSSSHSPPSLPLQILVRKKNFYLGNYQSSTFVQTPEIYLQVLKFTLNLVPCFCILQPLRGWASPLQWGIRSVFMDGSLNASPLFVCFF